MGDGFGGCRQRTLADRGDNPADSFCPSGQLWFSQIGCDCPGGCTPAPTPTTTVPPPSAPTPTTTVAPADPDPQEADPQKRIVKVFLMSRGGEYLRMTFESLGLGGDYKRVKWTSADSGPDSKWADGKITALDGGPETEDEPGGEQVFWSGSATEAEWPPEEWTPERRNQCAGATVEAGGFCAQLDAPGQWEYTHETRRKYIARLRGAACGAEKGEDAVRADLVVLLFSRNYFVYS